jgi:hypothetical protein
MKTTRTKKQIDPEQVEEELDKLLKDVKSKKSALGKMSGILKK